MEPFTLFGLPETQLENMLFLLENLRRARQLEGKARHRYLQCGTAEREKRGGCVFIVVALPLFRMVSWPSASARRMLSRMGKDERENRSLPLFLRLSRLLFSFGGSSMFSCLSTWKGSAHFKY